MPYPSHRSSLILFMMTTLLLLTTCHPLPERLPEVRHGKWYGVTKGLFRHQWWNYYERGLSFADGEFWVRAEEDLRDAIRLRHKDEWRARTYGMHFVNYFPHRELGVVLFRQTRLQEAVRELEISLDTAKSAKAEFYLDKVRKKRIENHQSDKSPPEIIIRSPEPGFSTNAFSILVRGVATDDTFVRHIAVNGKDFRVDVSDKEIPFQMETRLRPGKNRIPIQVKDLMGNLSETAVIVNADYTGPLMSLDQTAPEASVVMVKGYAFDDSGVAEMLANGQRFAYRENPRNLYFQESVSIRQGQTAMLVTLKDRFGNETSAKVPLKARSETGIRSGLIAENSFREISDMPKRALSSDLLAARIRFRDSGDEYAVYKENPKPRITYLKDAVIEGTAQAVAGVSFLSFNGEKDMILETPRKNVHFAFIVPLEENENIIEVRATDTLGYSDLKRIVITRIIPEPETIESRLELAIHPFQNSGSHFEPHLENALVRAGRFRVLPFVNHSENLDAAMKNRRYKKSDYILAGNLENRERAVTIYAYLWDTETEDRFLDKDLVIDVYDENVDPHKLREMARMMSLKLADELPLVKGVVKRIEGTKRVIVDIREGDAKKIKQGMKLVLYEQNRMIAEARVGEVRANTLFAILNENTDEADIQPADNAKAR